jgi:hypothetical protein
MFWNSDAYIDSLMILWAFLIVAFPIAVIVAIVKTWRDK